eukprot:TRINITY_DN25009_c0_g1_i1.p1 TRINITY_DN25009_c0_g1~~TRINITY_DN25009_c0_g1_i1.p1  ORF type:complete len:263 (-),score=42.43 TRINITY_DN25009_c0_g1_i1:196-984(-)
MAGGDDFTNLAETWKSKGAHEFVPAPVHPRPFVGPGQVKPAPQQRYPHQMRNQGNMAGGPYNGGWGNMPPGMGPSRGMGGMGMGPQHWNQVPGQGGWGPPPVYGPGPGGSGMPPHGQAQMMMQQQRQQARPPTPVLVWKLKAGKDEDTQLEKLKEDLENVDFAPQRTDPLFAYLDGCCLLWYQEEYMANALEVALDGTMDILETTDGQPLRVAKWPGVDAKFRNPEAASLPTKLLQHVAGLIQNYRKPAGGMGGAYPMTRGL